MMIDLCDYSAVTMFRILSIDLNNHYVLEKNMKNIANEILKVHIVLLDRDLIGD